MFDLILLMAGKGSRVGLDYNKIKYEINGIALYKYALNEFLKSKNLNKVILVVSKDDYEEFKNLKEFQNDRYVICVGGKERQDSVTSGLAYVTSDYVLVHDGARANIRIEEIEKVYEACTKYEVAALGVFEQNAIKKVKDNFIVEALDRADVVCMQTPQGAKASLLKEALDKLDTPVYDDVEAIKKVFNKDAYLVLGRYDNIKVTNKSDLELIKVLLKKE